MIMGMQCLNSYQLYVDSSKHEPTMSVNVSGIDATNDIVIKEKNNEDAGSQQSLSTKELLEEQNMDIFCTMV